MYNIESVKPLSDYRVWIKFSNGVEGIVDLSDIKGKGVFAKWKDVSFFNSVYIDSETHTLTWPGGIDLDTMNLYADIMGIQVDELIKKTESMK